MKLQIAQIILCMVVVLLKFISADILWELSRRRGYLNLENALFFELKSKNIFFLNSYCDCKHVLFECCVCVSHFRLEWILLILFFAKSLPKTNYLFFSNDYLFQLFYSKWHLFGIFFYWFRFEAHASFRTSINSITVMNYSVVV